MICHVIGNLLDADCDYICHQVNCQGRMGSGIAKSIKERWPIVYDQYVNGYKEREKEISNMCTFEYSLDVGETLLGHLQQVKVNNKQTVINMFAQQYCGYDGQRYTSYDAFWDCLEGIAASVPKGSKIGFPYGIGCGLGGANWKIIETMIEQVLAADYDIYIYHFHQED